MCTNWKSAGPKTRRLSVRSRPRLLGESLMKTLSTGSPSGRGAGFKIQMLSVRLRSRVRATSPVGKRRWSQEPEVPGSTPGSPIGGMAMAQKVSRVPAMAPASLCGFSQGLRLCTLGR